MAKNAPKSDGIFLILPFVNTNMLLTKTGIIICDITASPCAIKGVVLNCWGIHILGENDVLPIWDPRCVIPSISILCYFREEGKNLTSKVNSSNYHSLYLFSHCSTAATKAPILWLLSVPHPYWHHFYPFHHPIIIYSPQKINIIKHCNQIVVKGAWCMLRAQTLPGPS